MSNKQKIETSLKSLILDDDREFVAMISGEWGIGKTYFWKEFTNKYLKDKDVVYISLFGKNALADIETEVVTKLYKYNKGLKKYTKHLDTVGNMASKAMGLPINVSIGSLLSLFKASDFKNTIICFDDFERLSDKVPLKDVMGLISQFKEQKECKVIMILNEKELDKLSDIDGKKHDEIFALYKEKVVDYSFQYQPNHDELFEAIKGDIEKITFCEHQTIDDFFKKIDLKNIRIMKQALYQLGHFNFIDNDLDKKVINEFVEISLNLFVFKAKSNYMYLEFQDMLKYTPYERQKILQDKAKKRFDSENQQEKLEINQRHEENLIHYYSLQSPYGEYYSQNKEIIEKIIYNFIDTHTLLDDKLKKELKNNNQSLDWYDARNEISHINKRLWTDFSTKNTEIAKHLFEALEKYKDDMHRLFHYSDYKPLIENINKFSPEISTTDIEECIAKKCLEFYIISPDHEKYGPLDDSSETNLIISHYTWAEEYKNEQKRKLLTSSTNDVLALIEEALKSRYLSEDTSFILSQISTGDYKNLIKETPDFIQPLVKFLKMPDSRDVRKNIIDALNSLKDESDDYAWKVEQIAKASGIKLEEEK